MKKTTENYLKKVILELLKEQDDTKNWKHNVNAALWNQKIPFSDVLKILKLAMKPNLVNNKGTWNIIQGKVETILDRNYNTFVKSVIADTQTMLAATILK